MRKTTEIENPKMSLIKDLALGMLASPMEPPIRELAAI
jgi:hypothetical protein